MDPRAHSNKNLRFHAPENSWQFQQPDFDFLDGFSDRFSTQKSLLNEQQGKRGDTVGEPFF